MNALESLKLFLPETFLLCGAFLTLLLDLFVKNKKTVGILALAALTGAFFLMHRPESPISLFHGFYTLDALTHFFRRLSVGVVAISILVSLGYKPIENKNEGEYYSLFLFMAFGLILMAGSTNLLMIFMSIEFVSLLSYLFTGFLKKNAEAKEAAIKYFLFGSFASGLMLYGMSLLFGVSGSLELSVIQKAFASFSFPAFSMTALFLFVAGLGFKISMAPFHMWAPDAYQAAPTPVTGFLTVGPKAVGFAVLMRVLMTAFSHSFPKWQPALIGLSILTMTLGNFIAISQVNIKRLLAYSSIAQAGYILMGLAVSNDTGIHGVLIYLAVYALTNLGAFAAIVAASNQLQSDDLVAYSGLSKKSPFLAAMLTVFLLSLAGIPPLAGFIGKFYVFASAIQAGFAGFAVVAVLNSAVAAFYYFKIVRVMYLVEPENNEAIRPSFSSVLALCVLLAGTFLLGIFPSPLIDIVKTILI